MHVHRAVGRIITNSTKKNNFKRTEPLRTVIQAVIHPPACQRKAWALQADSTTNKTVQQNVAVLNTNIVRQIEYLFLSKRQGHLILTTRLRLPSLKLSSVDTRKERTHMFRTDILKRRMMHIRHLCLCSRKTYRKVLLQVWAFLQPHKLFSQGVLVKNLKQYKQEVVVSNNLSRLLLVIVSVLFTYGTLQLYKSYKLQGRRDAAPHGDSTTARTSQCTSGILFSNINVIIIKTIIIIIIINTIEKR